MLKIENEIPINIEAGENPFLRGVFGPIGREITADTLEVIGEIPDDLFGVYLRNGPNPDFSAARPLPLVRRRRDDPRDSF